MNIFDLREQVVADYGNFIRGFLKIRDRRLDEFVHAELDRGVLWPEPWISLNPNFEPGGYVGELVSDGRLHPDCAPTFRLKTDADPAGQHLRLHQHQAEAVDAAASGDDYVLTTGTGSGKSLGYIIPIVDRILREGTGGNGSIKAIVVYPMNALANSQANELEKFLGLGFPNRAGPVTFRRYTGQDDEAARQEIIGNPPDILLTNYVMAELLLTRVHERDLVRAAQDLQFLVLDELHTYRGRQGADVAMLVRRIRDACAAERLQCIGTSATLASEGPFAEQQADVAALASRVFGSVVHPYRVIGESLQRVTQSQDFGSDGGRRALGDAVAAGGVPDQYDAFVEDALAGWLEETFGVSKDATDRLVRAQPLTVGGPDGAAERLAALSGAEVDAAARAIRQGLLTGCTVRDPEVGRPVFAFRLHQFVTRGETVYGSLQPEDDRHITMQAQTYDPRDKTRGRVLLPLVFCRECGQDYYAVTLRKPDPEDPDESTRLEPRSLGDQDPDEGDGAFLYLTGDAPWPLDHVEVLDRVPDDWVEEITSGRRVRPDRQDYVPRPVGVHPDGRIGSHGTPGTLTGHLVRVPFRFCLCCGVAYAFTTRSDISKLTTLGIEGRSTATTMLSLSILRYLREHGEASNVPDKLLSFSDNRQDASLQAGHFNDFVQVSLLRAGLYEAVAAGGGLRHDSLAQAVFEALSLPLEEYALDPSVRYAAREDTERALRDVLAYRLYTDLQRGWRVTAPNLEQCGLLQIDYRSLDELCATDADWADAHQLLANADAATREHLARTLLDFMRRALAIKVDYLEASAQEQLVQRSNQTLVSPWGLDENEQERLERARILVARSRRRRDDRQLVHLSSRSNFGRFLRRVLQDDDHAVGLDEREQVTAELLERLRMAGILVQVREPADDEDVPGYQVRADALVWRAGNATAAAHDPTRVPNPPEEGMRVNEFFVDYYRHVASELRGLGSKEHTAQVPNEEREHREDDFREGRLPLLFCSPTMELGIDIADLNVVGLRNVPPTPANYAQRSGRAGRSGQPALVVTYCSTGSSHDQYYFRRPTRLVSGQVSPPRIDLANEDLVRAHVHAIWLAEAGADLGSSLKDILDLSGEDPSLDLLPSVQADVNNAVARTKAKARANSVLASIQNELAASDWWTSSWLDETLQAVALRFEAACDRWRTLYRAAQAQRAAQNAIIGDASRSQAEKAQAKRLRGEAESQLALLTADDVFRWQSDFYSYRYFASEGFLPGYNFPRLPLSAYIPARRRRAEGDDFLSRPRFLAVSEFGPRSFVYHEGSRYVVNRVILPVGDTVNVEKSPARTVSAKQCGSCGYVHPLDGDHAVDTCRFCGEELDEVLSNLFRMQNVSARRQERINSDEEERQRRGYELRTGVEFPEIGGRPSYRTGSAIAADGADLAALTYGERATLWRINLGWSRRDRSAPPGFVLDVERGYWSKASNDLDPDDPMTPRTELVVPYVEDRRNALLLRMPELASGSTSKVRLSLAAALQAALRRAIQVHFNLEDSELAAEPLPSRDDPRLLLIYEASEGGAGVLRRLVDDSEAVAAVARQALEICHFDEDGNDQGRAPGADEDCVAACYDCLMSYTNQPDHRLLDRFVVREMLLALADGKVEASPAPKSRGEHLEYLRRLCSTKLERSFLDRLEARGLRLPSDAQVTVSDARTRPDFVYEEACVAIYVDGPHHQYPERAARDQDQQTAMENLGWTVLRFGANDDWDSLLERYHGTFGSGS